MLENIAKIGVVVLAAGKGTRLGCIDKPKVMLEIGGRPVVSYIVEILFELGLKKEQIMLVVGFCKEKVQDYFGETVSYAVQEEQKGTAHAAYVGMRALSIEIEQVLVLNGDDSAFYSEQTLENFVNEHMASGAVVSVLTVESGNPTMSRMVRDANDILKIVEKENLTNEQKIIRENSTGTFCIKREWFEQAFLRMKPLRGLGEYGLNMVLEMAQQDGLPVRAVKLKNNQEWLGINTLEELAEADKRKNNL